MSNALSVVKKEFRKAVEEEWKDVPPWKRYQKKLIKELAVLEQEKEHAIDLVHFEKQPAHSRVFKHELAGKAWCLFFQPASSVLDSLLRKGPLALFLSHF